jgi:hypothetical protein
MLKNILPLFLIVLMIFNPGDAHSQNKLAQTGFQFLSVGTDARATAMGESFTTMEGNSSSLFYNPAGLARVKSFLDISLNQTNWIADIDYVSGSLAINLADRKYGVFGVSFLSVNYGEFLWTQVANNDRGFNDIKNWPEPYSLMFGVGYGKDLSDKFAVGGQIKYVNQNLGRSYVPIFTENDTLSEEVKYSLDVFAFDFGTIYKTGFKSLTFGMTVRNFAKEIKFEKESFQLPLTFKIGVSINAFDFLPSLSEAHSLIISLDAVHPRSYPEFLNIGGEYTLMNMLALRLGYITNNDDYGLTTGFGINKYGFAIDYSYTPFDVFENINRVSIRFSIL